MTHGQDCPTIVACHAITPTATSATASLQPPLASRRRLALSTTATAAHCHTDPCYKIRGGLN
eukprot:CAMPEP_0181204398 /NCGR_PEP_ID=MMETSP1096-20121128/19916_1 /TAXON_ID=156174 ORGANISM="Chrysochromulina ericina, Strain CCMP281" /NCGR_SAMPLE_ID=MMETSP1096 /ASSEMBLY_ACC=CAM_ASM_000453 /LENGTH=61 /DNA_ID=CAMNT_0023295099 /DNA_START=222 /DNA_END=407 /DNA_ORIENTATION=-